MKNVKSILLGILIVLLSIIGINTIYADDEDNELPIEISIPQLNYIEDDIDASRLEHNFYKRPLLKAENYPTKFSLEDDGYVTSVKYQYPYGTCWSFAAIGSAESIYKKKTGIELDLSELQLAWFTYNNYGIADSLNLIKNDGGQYQYSLSDNIDAPLDLGGNQEFATNALISGIGLSLEENSSLEPEQTITTKPSDDECYSSDYRIVDVDWYSMNNRNDIKSALMYKGGLASSYYHDDLYLSNDGKYIDVNKNPIGGKSYYCNRNMPENHAILIVGWDDNYPASNFKTQPQGNGAWRCKNSWSEFWGDDGYFYISYYDKSLSDVAFAYTVEECADDYDIYQYDGGYSYSYNYVYGKNIFVANEFNAQDNISIEKVGLSTLDADTYYSISIYVGCNNNEPKSGDLALSEKTGSIKNAGYHTIALDDEIKVSKGSNYSIIVKYYHQNNANVYVPIDSSETVSKVKFNNSYANDYSYKGTTIDNLTKISSYNVKVKAYTKLDTEGNQYAINYYYQNIDNDEYTLKETKTKYSTETTISLNSEDLAIEGFTLNTGESNLSGANNGSLELNIKYDRNKYNLTYALNGGEFPNSETYGGEIKYETLIIKPNNPTKNDYNFSGWDKEIPNTMPANDLTITAQWVEKAKANYYIIHHTQSLNDLELFEVKSENIEIYTDIIGNTITVTPKTITGYTYSSDITSSKGGIISGQIEESSSFDTATKFDLYYLLNEHTVTLNKGTGIKSVSGDGNYYYGETITINAELEDGYEFVEWTGDKTNSKKNYSFKIEDENITLTANAETIKYSITYVLNSGTVTDNPSEYTVTTDDITLNNPTRDGYTFIGWSEGASDILEINVTIPKGSVGNKTYTAKWLKNEINVSSIGLVKDNIVYIDGEKYTVGDSGKINISDVNKKVITTYTMNDSQESDVHKQYATHLNVYLLEKQGEDLVPVHKDKLDDIVTYAGTAIRLTGKKGIRIITSVPTIKKSDLTNGTGIYDYKLYEYGAIMCWANGSEPTLIKQADGSYKASSGANAAAYSLSANKNLVYKQENGLTKFSTVLTEGTNAWTDTQCESDFAMRSYIILRPKNCNDSSQDVIIYGGTIYRSISYVATQNKDKYDVGTNNYEFIWNLVKCGYPDLYESDHRTLE